MSGFLLRVGIQVIYPSHMRLDIINCPCYGVHG